MIKPNTVKAALNAVSRFWDARIATDCSRPAANALGPVGEAAVLRRRRAQLRDAPMSWKVRRVDLLEQLEVGPLASELPAPDQQRKTDRERDERGS